MSRFFQKPRLPDSKFVIRFTPESDKSPYPHSTAVSVESQVEMLLKAMLEKQNLFIENLNAELNVVNLDAEKLKTLSDFCKENHLTATYVESVAEKMNLQNLPPIKTAIDFLHAESDMNTKTTPSPSS